MNKAILKVYFVILGLAALLMVWALASGNDARYDRSSDLGKQELIPDSGVQLDEDTIEYQFEMKESQDPISACVEFFTNHQFVYVYADGELIYSRYPQASIFGNTAGTEFNFVELPVGTKNLTVDIQAVYPQVRGRSYTFYIGDSLGMYRTYIKRSLLDAAISFLHVVVGCLMVGYWLIFRKKVQQGPTILYFGLAVIMLGLWSLNETDLVTILLSDRRAGSFTSFLLLMLVLMPYAKFIHYFLEVPDRFISNGISLLSLANFVILTALHMSGIAALKQTVICTHILLVATFLYMIGSLIWRFKQFGLDHLMKANLIAAAMVFLSIFLDLGAFYNASEQTDVIGRLCILVYVVIIGSESIREFLRQINEGRKAELYKQLAETDVMTGMFNRSAFEKWESEENGMQDLGLVTFDLNNLKQCNDTLGHAAGDRYIVDAAGLIRQCFGSYAKCYRIGGDEFCAVVRCSRQDIENCIENLRNAEWVYNRTSNDVVMKIACGYSFYQEGDSSVEDIRSRADVLMYRDKKKIKEKM
jgi:diguanylate cyclase (GGDEF)-like protein